MRFSLLIFLVLFGVNLYAQAPKKEIEEIEILADHSELSLTAHTALFKGNVIIIDPPDTQVKCDQLLINLSTNNSEINMIFAEGNVVITLKNKDGLFTATGKKAVFDWKSNILTLTGDPLITTPMGPFSGAEKVILDRNKSTMFASGGRQRLGVDTSKMNRDADKKKNAEEPKKQ